jgi:hypothetical protein
MRIDAMPLDPGELWERLEHAKAEARA